MTRKFEDEAAKPVIKLVPNEFEEVVAYLAEDFSRVKSYVISADTRESALLEAAADKRKMAEAGNALTEAVTVKTRHEWQTPEILTGSKDTLHRLKVYMFAGKKIVRKPKTAE